MTHIQIKRTTVTEKRNATFYSFKLCIANSTLHQHFFFFGFSCKELPVAHIDPRNQVLGDGLLRVNILFQERVGKEWDVFNDTE